jgi:hypothetical protein
MNSMIVQDDSPNFWYNIITSNMIISYIRICEKMDRDNIPIDQFDMFDRKLYRIVEHAIGKIPIEFVIV